MGSQLGHTRVTRSELPPNEVDPDEEEYDEEAEEEARWANRDFYGVLQLPASASLAEIKKSFKRIALTYHPDKVGPEDKAKAAQHFQSIAEAYEVLSQDRKRYRYDRVLRQQASRREIDELSSNVKPYVTGTAFTRCAETSSKTEVPPDFSRACAPEETSKPPSSKSSFVSPERLCVWNRCLDQSSISSIRGHLQLGIERRKRQGLLRC